MQYLKPTHNRKRESVLHAKESSGVLVEGAQPAVTDEHDNIKRRMAELIGDILVLLDETHRVAGSATDDIGDLTDYVNDSVQQVQRDIASNDKNIAALVNRVTVLENAALSDIETAPELPKLPDPVVETELPAPPILVSPVKSEPDFQAQSPIVASDAHLSLPEIIVDRTVGGGDGSHEASISAPNGYDWTHGPKMSSGWGRMKREPFHAAECRYGVWFDRDNPPTDHLLVEIEDPRYYELSNAGAWSAAVRPSKLDGRFLGDANRPNINPFDGGTNHGDVPFTRPMPRVNIWQFVWKNNAAMAHFWHGWRRNFGDLQVGELLVARMRALGDYEGNSGLLAGGGIDYYQSASHSSVRAPGPGIQKSVHLTKDWRWIGFFTPPAGTTDPIQRTTPSGWRLMVGSSPLELLEALTAYGLPDGVR